MHISSSVSHHETLNSALNDFSIFDHDSHIRTDINGSQHDD